MELAAIALSLGVQSWMMSAYDIVPGSRAEALSLPACIMADGIDSDGSKRTGFQIYDEQLYDIALFLKWVL